jgi:hypothetical protein
VVPPDSHGVSRVPRYLGYSLVSFSFAYRVVTFCDWPFQTYSAKVGFRDESPATPRSKLLGLGWSRFARRYSGNRFFFLLLRVLRCFSSPGSLRTAMNSLYGDWILLQPGFPIRTPPDLRLLAAPRGISLLSTSFFGSQRQGIHRMPLLT